MSERAAQAIEFAGRVLHEVSPPVEPRVAYEQAHLASTAMLALVRGRTFLTANRFGNLMPRGAPHVGLFRDDTRYLSQLDLRINGQPPIALSSSVEAAYIARTELTVKGDPGGEGLDFPVNTIYVHRDQLLETDTLYDVVQFENFYNAPARLRVDLEYDADFVDIFQVRGMIRGRSGRHYAPLVADDSIEFIYDGLDGRRLTTAISFAPNPEKVEGKTASWDLVLAPLGKAKIATVIRTHARERHGESDAGIRPLDSGRALVQTVRSEGLMKPLQQLRAAYDRWSKDCTCFHSDNGIYDAMLKTAADDFYALQIPDKTGKAVAAGVPWFAALFGRDSLIASFQSLILNPALAEGTLRVLAYYQGQEVREDRDEEPGKILHELRCGEMTATGEIAFGRNYGSVDATPLFIILLGEYYRWSGNEALLEDLAMPLARAVEWILTYADIDGDGLVKYRRKTPQGLFNQGWKDSGDANMHVDGRIAQAPIALVEVQGYAIRALSDAAVLLRKVGGDRLAERAVERAGKMRGLLEQVFWMSDKNYYAMALDKDQELVRAIASNPGHLLFSGVLSPERAEAVADTLLGHGLYSGWGIRTLSQDENIYNPMSYHRGSVWPHDNSLIGFGLASNGLTQQASRVVSALYEAALYYPSYRLPELFCGIACGERSAPVQYPVSCSPQAWASGSPFLLLTGMLGLRPHAAQRELRIVNPHLPQFLSFLRIENLRVFNSRITMEFSRQGPRTYCNVVSCQGEPIDISIAFHPRLIP